MSTIKEEILKRRTFAIISHPDAGKTTLTEKFLLYGKAIQSAGSVKGRRGGKHATSDWMEIEKQRGISVTSSVLQFNYDGYCINILDTPGHQDFSEDTYRTLMAADCAVMVIDASKGVEAQTKKLFKVCMLRKIPIFTFINKMDRFSMDPFVLLEGIEKDLGIKTYPMNWPIGSGKDFKGVYVRDDKNIITFEGGAHGSKEVVSTLKSIDDPAIKNSVSDHFIDILNNDVELLDGAFHEYNDDEINCGQLTPVFFGSALTNFGVEPFLQNFLTMSSSPTPRVSDAGLIEPVDDNFSAFVFKIQANMNKAHRDRIAFMRIVSGKFSKGLEVRHVQANKKIKLSQPQQFMASDREIIEEAYAGDVIGVFDPGIFSIGDTLCAVDKNFKFSSIPTFAPEHFARVSQKDTMKRKQFLKGITQIAQEGAIQVFQEINLGMEEILVGAVGVLQFEVLQYRLLSEYNVEIKLDTLDYNLIRWVDNSDIDMNKLNLTSDTKRVKDLKGNNLIILKSYFALNWAIEHNKELLLSEVGTIK